MLKPDFLHKMATIEAKCFRPLDQERSKIQMNPKGSGITPRKVVRITEYGDVICPPDQAKLTVTCESVKDTAHSALESVSRRQSYILQTLKSNKIKQGCISVHERLSRVDNSYRAVCETEVIFSNAVTAEKVSNHFVLKLDDSVTVSQLHFYHSIECLEKGRRQAATNAVRNAKIKALTMAQFLNQLLGQCTMIEEDETKESLLDNDNDNIEEQSLLRTIRSKTVRISVKISAEFSMKHHSINK